MTPEQALLVLRFFLDSVRVGAVFNDADFAAVNDAINAIEVAL